MSESELHRDLIRRVEAEIKSRYPKMFVIIDIQAVPGDPVPPMVNRFRPDVYAFTQDKKEILIAEAKTDGDIDTPHTHKQACAFVRYLEKISDGHLIFSVTFAGANLAKTFLRFLFQELNATRIRFSVFDECDLWSLDLESGVQWRLS